MEKMSTVQFVLMVSLVLGLLVGHSTASCKDQCSAICKSHPSENFEACVTDCLKSCNPPNAAQFFCKLGCASSMCVNLNTKENPEKMGRCTESCSKTCTKI